MRITSTILTSFLLLQALIVPAQKNDTQLANEYYRRGEIDKAVSMYESLAKNPRNIPVIHQNYFEAMLNMRAYKQASKYIDKVIRQYPTDVRYAIDKGILFFDSGDKSRGDNYMRALVNAVSKDYTKTRRAVQYMVSRQLLKFASLTLISARKYAGNPTLYSIDLANIYRMQNKKDLMVTEYMKFASQNPGNIQYVKNTFQVLLTEPEDLESLERLLFSRVQQHPDNDVYSEMLIWVSLQEHNFYGAFVQARAVDRRKQLGGNKILSIGTIALDNKDYKTAIQIFNFIVDHYPKSNVSIQAQLYRINARENLVKTTYPIDQEEVLQLVNSYDVFIKSFGDNRSTYQASLNKANLYAYYLDQKSMAIDILNALIRKPRISLHLQAKAKLALADIYLLNNEPWESALLYAQVDKSMKETNIGYEAKLKNAKLAYYKGDFKLAQEYLDILKMATSREIANDAMDLSIFISNNSIGDTTNVVLKTYAGVELLLFQHKTDQALRSIDSLLTEYPGDKLTDDLLYLKAGILKSMGHFNDTAMLLKKISTEYGEGLLGDKAYYELASLYENQMHDSNRAMTIYEDFLRKYPGSIYTAEARKHFRILRGDPSFTEKKADLFN